MLAPIIATVCFVLLAIVTLVMFAMSLYGTDLAALDRFHAMNPPYYRNLKRVCRINGLMVIAMSLAGIVATPFVAITNDGGLLLAFGLLTFSAIYLWLSARWFRWSFRP